MSKQVNDVFGYIEQIKKNPAKDGKMMHYAFLVQAVGLRAATKPQWYNAYATTFKGESFLDSFKNGQLVGIDLTKNTTVNNIASIHNASKKPAVKQAKTSK